MDSNKSTFYSLRWFKGMFTTIALLSPSSKFIFSRRKSRLSREVSFLWKTIRRIVCTDLSLYSGMLNSNRWWGKYFSVNYCFDRYSLILAFIVFDSRSQSIILNSYRIPSVSGETFSTVMKRLDIRSTKDSYFYSISEVRKIKMELTWTK